MGSQIGARKDASFKAISTAPSFNKTPVGGSTPPLPYATIQDLDNSVGVVANVRFNGKPVYVLDQSTQPSGKGDEPGVAKGVKSGTVGGEVKPVKGSSTVRVGKKPVVRKGDPCTMNGGNNPGIYCTTQVPSAAAPKGGSTPAKLAPQTEAEESFVQRAMDRVRSAAKGYQKNVSPSLHDFAGRAMNKGGTIAASGGGAALIGGAMVATGVGAAPGAVIAASGGAVAAVGGGVSTAGAIAETAATGIDAAASFIVSGNTPDVIGMATAYAERVVGSKLEKVVGLIPGMKEKVRQLENKAEEQVTKPSRKKVADGGNDKQPGPAGDGVKIKGEGDGGGRCKLRPYRQLKNRCPGCGTPHHVVPDHCFKQTGSNGTYYAGAVEHDDAMHLRHRRGHVFNSRRWHD